MKVILLRNMERLGKAGEIVDVAPGYGRNFLFPNGYAEILTRKGQKQVDIRKMLVAKKAGLEFDAAKELAQHLEGQSFMVKAKVGARGKLYGAITTQAVADAINIATGAKVDKRNITLAEPVRMLGGYNATIRLHSDVQADFRINVIAAEGSKIQS